MPSWKLIVAAVVLSAAMPWLARASQELGTYQFNIHMALFGVELIKLTFAISWKLSSIQKCKCTRECRWLTICAFKSLKHTSLCSPSRQTRFLLAAFLNTIQNNLNLVVLVSYCATTFQAAMSLGIALVAPFSAVVLGQNHSGIQWQVIVLVCVGALQHSALLPSPLESRSSSESLALVALVVTGALANVYNQFSFQIDPELHVMTQNVFLYSYGALLTGINWARSICQGQIPFGHVGMAVLVLILFASAHGLCISVVLKKFGALQQCILALLACVASAVYEFLSFAVQPTTLKVTTYAVMLIASRGYVLVFERSSCLKCPPLLL